MKLSVALLAVSACALTAVLGAWAGARSVQRRFARIVAAHERAGTLGALLPAEQRANVAQAYSSPLEALANFDSVAWEPAKTPAPFLGYVPTPGEAAGARHNSLGWRSRELVRPKPADVVRVFLTGGSTAYGVGALSHDATIGAFLEQRLNAELARDGARRFEVHTVAAPAWSSTHERIAIENLIAGAEPDIVVALTGVNDIHWGWRGADVMWMRTYADEYFRLLHNAALEAAGRAPSADVAPLANAPVEPGEVGVRFERNQRLSWYASASADASYIVALQPCLHVTESSRRAPADGEPSYFAACFDQMRRRMLELNLHLQRWSFVDLTPLFDADHGREHVYIDSYHFGDKGNRRIADALFEAVRAALSAGGQAR